MQPTQHPPPAPELSFRDILFVLLRHKGKILTLSTLGVLGAVALYLFWPVPYQSEARLFIKYVVDSRPPAQDSASDGRPQMASERTGDTVINTEVEILTSLDLAQQAAAGLPRHVLAKLAGGTNLVTAAIAIRNGLLPEVVKQSDVIHVIFKNRESGVVQPVLKGVIDTYLIRHAEIHRALGVYDDYLTKLMDERKSRLAATEKDLRKAKAKAGIISLEDSKKYDSDQMARLQQAIMDADAQLAEHQAEAGAVARLLPTNSPPAASRPAASNLSAGANVGSGPSALAGTSLAAGAEPVPVPAQTVDEYKRVCRLLDGLNKREEELSMQFTPETSFVKGVRAQIAAGEKAKKKLEDENPGLLAAKTLDPRFISSGAELASGSSPASSAQMELITAMAKVPALQSRLRVLTNQLEIIRKEASVVAEAEGPITELERQRDTEAAQYTSFQKNLEELAADEQLGASRNSNIVPFQTPSPPFRAASKLLKAAALLLFGSVGGALALAFALEYYIDPSIKRSSEIEDRLHLPLFLSIPRLRLNGKASRQALGTARIPLLAQENGAGDGTREPEAASQHPALDARLSVAPWEPRHKLRPFDDALRDRLITYFDLNNLTHKPKMVALTSCGEGSGVTTLSAGLAASLSETGEGKVLLVDMNEHASVCQFFRGNPACGLEDALELETRDTAMVQEKLYVVRENRKDGQLPRCLPKDFQRLVPKLKASDYDYIIFDMPPVSQVSVTSKLARFMDITLVVVEAEETDREVVKRASSFLAQSGTKVGVVLNKTRSYGPKRLVQEF
ncbi:MAG: GumC family protein [Limisphaerales bacterium]